MVVKLNGTQFVPHVAAAIGEASTRAPVFLLDETLSRADLLALMGCCDALVSLHRSEGFGLPIAEAMACGAPVIAYNRGSVPEIIDDGLTGFVVEDENGAVAAVERLSTLSRPAIRKQFEARFTARRMALDYLAAFRSLTEAAKPRIKLVSSAE